MIGPLILPQEKEVARDIEARFLSFITDEVNPGALERDARCTSYPRSLLERAGQIGLLGYGFPTEVGGGGADRLRLGIFLEQLGYHCSDTAFVSLLGLRTSIANAIFELGRPDLIDRYVRPAARGACFMSFSYTEDADPFSFRSRAARDPDGSWVVNGEKKPVMGGQHADVVLTYLGQDNGDIAVALLERTDPGVELVPVEVTGMRSNGPCLLRMTDARIPAERMLIASDGLSQAQRNLNERRLWMACPALGRMSALYEQTIRVTLETKRYGKPIAEMQLVQATLGRMYVVIEAARALTYRALDPGRVDFDAFFDPLSSAAKVFIGEQCNLLALSAARPLATHTYLDAAFAQYSRDFATLMTNSGTQDSLEVSLGGRAIHTYRKGLARNRV